MINSHNTWGALILCFCLLAAHSVTAQSLQRKVFSPAGSVFSHNGQEYGFTIGEPMIGTDLLTIPYLTKGFQQPEPLFLLAPEITLHQVLETREGILLNWSSSHHAQANQYQIEYAIDGGSFVPLDKVLPGPGSQTSYVTKVEFPSEKRLRFKVIQELAGGTQISSNEIEIMIAPLSVGWKLQPNPTTENYTELEFGTPISGGLSLKVFTQLGQLVREEQVQLSEAYTLRFSTEHLAAGMYIVKVDHPIVQGMRRLIVEK